MILQRFLELRPAIAFERAEHVAGQAFAVQADQRRLAARTRRSAARHAPARRRTRGRRRSACRAGLRAAAWRGRRSRPRAAVARARSRRADTLAAASRGRASHSAGSSPAERASASAAVGASRRSRAAPDEAARSARARGPGPGSAIASAVSASSQCASLDQHRLRRVGRVALVGERQRRRALAADQQPRLAAGIEDVEQFGRRRLDRDNRDRLSAVDPHRPPGAQRGDRPRTTALASNLDLADQRHMVGRPLPVAARLEHSMRHEMRRQARATPTYGRAGGRGRSWSSRASDSSTR